MKEIIKRQIDFLGSLLGLIILIPLFLIISLLIKLDSKGPVFFRQERLGKDGKLFRIYKLRTMIKNAENKGSGLFILENDDRITTIGRFLRKWSIDELPQLINILKGEMILVGPRPGLTQHLPHYNLLQKKDLKLSLA